MSNMSSSYNLQTCKPLAVNVGDSERDIENRKS